MGHPYVPTFSLALLRPFAKLLAGRDGLPFSLTEAPKNVDEPGQRMPVAQGLALIDEAVRLTGDPDLGLRAALMTEVGDFEVLEWVAAAAATWREANAVVRRYARVLNEAANYRLVVCGPKAHLMLGSSYPLSRAAVDYQLAAYHLALQLRVRDVPDELEIWFRHPEPAATTVYQLAFPGAALVFGAAFDGFVTDAWRLDTPMPTANVPLHDMLRDYADRLLRERQPEDHLPDQVAALIRAALPHGNITASSAAAELSMSRRTLTRRLTQSGTSFTTVLREVRYQSAVHYLRDTHHSIEDIAFILGYSECPPFIRAFRRWSGYAPLEFRQRLAATTSRE